MLLNRAARRARALLPSIGALIAALTLGALLTLPASAGAVSLSGVGFASWSSASQSDAGNRNAPLEFQINARNVSQLAPKWVFTDHGDVSATPTVANGAVYFPDFGGYMNALNAVTGALIWQRQIDTYAGETASTPSNPIVARDSPLVLPREIVFGDNASTTQPGGAHVLAVNPTTGNLIWSTQVDTNPAAIITSSPVAFGNEIVVGIASNEEADAESASYPCCSFRGAVVALNSATGKIIWKTYTVPSNTLVSGDSNTPCTSDNPAAGCGYTGGAVWGIPTIDAATGQVFVGTGNNYTATDAAVACETAALNANPPQDDANCTASNDYFDAVLALNLYNGSIEWGQKVEGWDAWNVACLIGYKPGATWCPSPASPDFDFSGSSPNLMTVMGSNGLPETLVGEGQKSGIYWAFNPANGNIVWDTLLGPGTSLGGVEWGSAYDGKRIYTAEADPFGIPYTLANGTPVTGGSWAALYPDTGTIEWQTAVPGGYAALGPVSSANGVVYAGSMDPNPSDPDMFALDAENGQILWSFSAGSSVNASPAIANGMLYWGSGYAHLGPDLPFTGNDKFYGFSLGGK